jgi:FkbM family methyltransferase
MANRLSTLGITNIIPKNRAISDSTNSVLYMKIYPNRTDSESCTVEQLLWNEERMPANTKIVEVLTEKVDDILKNEMLPPVRFIKIDTEGHEHAVIRGARELLLMHRPLVIFEYGYQKGFWEPDTIRQMEEVGYICYDCNTDKRVHPGYGNEAVPYLLTDVLAIPIEFEDEVVALLLYLY